MSERTAPSAGAPIFIALDPSKYTIAPAAPAIALPALFTVALTAPRAAGDFVRIKGMRLGSRTADVTRNGRVQSQTLEAELDRRVVTEQELRRDVNAAAATVLLFFGSVHRQDASSAHQPLWAQRRIDGYAAG